MHSNSNDSIQPTYRFRTIYVVQVGQYDFSILQEYGDDIQFVTTGFEEFHELPQIFAEKLQDFSPADDALVAVGKSNTTLLLGAYLRRHFPGEEIALGVYYRDVNPAKEKLPYYRGDPKYRWERVVL